VDTAVTLETKASHVGLGQKQVDKALKNLLIDYIVHIVWRISGYESRIDEEGRKNASPTPQGWKTREATG
jgi:hypothetical protein